MPGRGELPDLTSPRRLQLYLEQRGLRPLRSRGQNFLIDGNIARKIIDAAALECGGAVIEIGPGAGALTSILARRSMNVVALELDRGLAAALKEMLRFYPRVIVLQGDALDVRWRELNHRYFGAGTEVDLVSNLPYHISGPLLYALFKQNLPFRKILLMLQKEVAARLIAVPGSGAYGALSVLCRYYSAAEVLFPVSRNVFWPAPKVDSAVVRLQRRKTDLSAGEEAFFRQIVQESFRQRRKMLTNSLGNLFPCRDGLRQVLQLAGVDPAARAEMLSMEQFAKVARIAYNCNVKPR